MAVSVLYDAASRRGCLLCTATDCAFGPVFEGVTEGDQLMRFVDWATCAGMDPRDENPETLLAAFASFAAEERVETALAFRCGHCENVLAPEEIRSVHVGFVAGAVSYETPCPRCHGGDGDFEEVQVCVGCGLVCDSRAAHVGCVDRKAPHVPSVARDRKPPAASVARAARKLREA